MCNVHIKIWRKIKSRIDAISFRTQERFLLLSILVLTPCHSSPLLQRVKRFSHPFIDVYCVNVWCELCFSFNIVQDFCVRWIAPIQLSTGINFGKLLVITLKPYCSPFLLWKHTFHQLWKHTFQFGINGVHLNIFPNDIGLQAVALFE